MIAVRQYSSGSEIIAARTALRKRLLSPQTRPTAKPVLTLVKTDVRASEPRVWREQHDSHVRAYLEWKGNEPLGFLKLRCREMGVNFEDIATKGCRKQVVVKPRQALMGEVKTRYPMMSLPAIGRLFGGFDHTTVLHSLRCVGIVPVTVYSAKLTSREEHANIRRLLDQGKTQGEIGLIVGMSQTAVSHIVRRNGWSNISRRRRVENHKDEIKAMFDAGSSFSEISRAINYNPENISRLIRRMGWTR